MAPLHLYTLHSEIDILDSQEKPYIRKFHQIPVAPQTKNNSSKIYKWNIRWQNVIFFSILHLISLYGLYLAIFKNFWILTLYGYAYGIVVSQGITAGAHRLWAHRSYKAKLPLKLILLFLQTSSFQNSVYEWARDHRVHHKYTDSDADPHNAKRGFFFSHMGWLLIKKQEDVKVKGKSVDMSDLKADPYIMWQHKYYVPLMLICCFVIPTIIPWYFWEPNYWPCFVIAGALRYTFSLHSTWLVNSAAHIYGMKPYDKTIGPTQNYFVSFMAIGEGFHNYHHVFPWDYKTAELGNLGFNWTLAAINTFAKIGWAFDLKTVSPEMVRRRSMKTGDGSWIGNIHENVKQSNKNSNLNVWGWGDDAMTQDDVICAQILNKSDD